MSEINYVLSDFPESKVDAGSLHSEVNASLIKVKLSGVEISEDLNDIKLVFLADLDTEDLASLDEVVGSHLGELIDSPSVPVTVEGIPDVTLRRPVLPQRAYAFSQNWCDKTTWYMQSVKVEDKLLGFGDGVTKSFVLEEDFPVIEIGRGKVSDDHLLVDEDGDDYLTKVSTGTTTGGYTILSEREPFEEDGGDFWVDYDNPGTDGTMIYFETAPANGEEILVTYRYCPTDTEGHSAWHFMPPPGKKWVIDHVEAQFTSDVELTDTIIYQAWLNHPQVGWMAVPGQPELRYHTANNYDDFVKGAQPEVPAWGGPGKRGRAVSGRVIQWDYQSSIVLSSSQGVAIKIWCKHDRAMEGTRVTITIYALEEDE